MLRLYSPDWLHLSEEHPQNICVSETSSSNGHPLHFLIYLIGIRVEISFSVFQEHIWIRTALSWLTAILDTAVDPHIRIGGILSNFFPHDQDRRLIDMEITLLLQFFQQLHYWREPVTVTGHDSVRHGCTADVYFESFSFFFMTV